MSDVLLHAIQQAAKGLLPLDELDAAIHDSGLLLTSSHERSAGAAQLDVEAYREALREMIEHDAEQSANCGDWGTNPCLIRERVARLLDAAPSPKPEASDE